ncbi:MAG: hypothetical protein ACLSH6_02310 [Limosilactobacillus pontis]
MILVGLNKQVIGLLAIQDAPKPTSAAAIAALKTRATDSHADWGQRSGRRCDR